MKIYIHIDGDNVGNSIEILLMDGRLDDACYLSEKIRNAFDSIKERVSNELAADIHIYAGDDLIISTDSPRMVEELNNICFEFHEKTGITLSIGIGSDIKESLSNLRRAKISGRNKIVGIKNG